ncbi:MAG: FAD-dependent monooxygenase, partial [Microthrixaceae bacterium]|nr:FAD-dependent monooxygenase [Microthrixaceae bacterium]
AWGAPPYNGATAYRPDFDQWLATHATAAGAELICSTTVTGVLRDGNRVVGVRTDRPDGELTARTVIACDGVNSFVAKEAGLYGEVEAHHYTVGVKETIRLGRDVIDQRFGLRGLDGADFEIVGCTNGIPGGGFLYTNLDTVAVGVVLELPSLAKQDRRPEQILAGLKSHPAIAPFLEGGEIGEYSAHVIPEGGLAMMPELVGDGLLVAGDAAAMCLAAGIWLEGVNFAIASGHAAGLATADALRRGDTSAAGLSGYRRRLETTFVLADHRKLAGAPELMMSPRMQRAYPQVACNTAERLFTVENPRPKTGLNAIVRSELKAAGVKVADLGRDALRGLRSFG